jgi:hypothetical protein
VRPVSVQREFTFTLAPELEWTLTGRLDVEDADGSVIDVKVKKRHVAQADADSDPQPSLYLLERALSGRPAPRFLSLDEPGGQAGQDENRRHAPRARSCRRSSRGSSPPPARSTA